MEVGAARGEVVGVGRAVVVHDVEVVEEEALMDDDDDLDDSGY